MDIAWALDELGIFERMTVLTNNSRGGFVTSSSSTASPDGDVAAAAAVVEQILDRVIADWRTTIELRSSNRWTRHREATLRAITILRRQEELREKLGDNAPTLDASRLHPWAWDGARSMWGSRQYAQAVVDALKKVNAEAQLKVGRRDVSETDLFNQLFSLDAPKADRPRLRLMPDDGSDTYSSVHRGARSLAEGLFAGVRNRLSHEVTESPAEEQHALEQLAAVSVLARWVDDAEVVTAP
ncbi:Protein of unknown function (Hypoth_ymh) [Klenkia marina]|uniref:Conserved hypothetical protein CHP02391 domain-containing protein n=1 Tax=Klenkia marina TaxID=1960309 RepID=A0A1G4Z4G5_9ACTN|nr:TIGR02391 family protein [Klenkia marina]SCX60543.1 Protein of unknown function (Hypoth_ymh) [Klenkia marina]